MDPNPTYYEELLAKYFSGETSPEETRVLSSWVKKSEENKKLFKDYKKTWELIEKSKIQATVSADEEWNRFKLLISTTKNSGPKIVPLFPLEKKSGFPIFLKIAAAVIILAVFSYILFIKTGTPETKKLLAHEKQTEAKLPDGTTVSLNKNSTLEYPEKFEGYKRQVKLEGEAFFEVTPDRQHPFIIEAGPVYAEVLGTSFYVNTQGKNGAVEVIVKTGKVAVYSKSNTGNKVILEPGDKTEFIQEQNNFTETKTEDDNFLAWKTGKLEFSDDPLVEIIATLNQTYHADIKIASPEISGCKITATFEKQELDAILNVISTTLNLQVYRQNGQIEIKGKGCK